MARVLVAENNPEVAEMIGRLVKDLGHEAVVVKDGRAAYERLLMEDGEFDLLVVDLHMPRMPGRALLRQVENLVRGVTPVIAVSGKLYYLDALGDVKDWLYAEVLKPFAVADLSRRIREAIETRASWLAARGPEDAAARRKRKLAFLVEQNGALYDEAHRDPMTGLPTRRALEEDFDCLTVRKGEHGGAFVLALCDIDGFRRFNKERGYEGGDEVLRVFARRLNASLRVGDTLYRYGGDEFVVLLQASDLAEGARAVERLQQCVADAPGPTFGGKPEAPLTFSAGIVLNLAEYEPTIERMLENAGKRLREAKAAGGRCIRPSVTAPTYRWEEAS